MIVSSFGITWIFGLLAAKFGHLALEIVFCVFNILNGSLLVLFRVLLSRHVRAAWLECCSCATVLSLKTIQTDPGNGTFDGNNGSRDEVRTPENLFLPRSLVESLNEHGSNFVENKIYIEENNSPAFKKYSTINNKNNNNNYNNNNNSFKKINWKKENLKFSAFFNRFKKHEDGFPLGKLGEQTSDLPVLTAENKYVDTLKRLRSVKSTNILKGQEDVFNVDSIRKSNFNDNISMQVNDNLMSDKLTYI
ncbi:hypothetical protein HELRODRAFT_179360 [Helobdella robusta]|uniref:G-protein coupled receptors family 2 profile 2 domain-containing protein n=1 Tax=Helobdella robusta TaxID=6412 RepID=T1FEL8_HELRO|nr:hypothetical protein HELRODRAFT_179360 [Helobdella robusta]ESN95583.1 hypothetical protein HELRODRAFT_179360 [Helobdella robusta]